jgi:hypothetical protein
LGFIFLVLKLNDMIFFATPSILQITIQGTPQELQTVYDAKKLGNTSFAIQVKQEEIDDDDVEGKQK